MTEHVCLADEVKWLNKGEEHNTYISREKLEEMGWGKMVQRMDQQEALRAGLATRPLTTKFVEKQVATSWPCHQFAGVAMLLQRLCSVHASHGSMCCVSG